MRGPVVHHYSRRLAAALLAIIIGSGVTLRPVAASAEDIIVFAAASLKNALDEIAVQYADGAGQGATISYAASSALARQIESGAPADIFISADRDWMDYLAERGLIRPETRADLLGNRLVLIAPADSTTSLTIEPGFALAEALGDERLAMAGSEVPAGRYAQAALEALGAWPAVSERAARAENVRAALALVSRGEAPFGIVYQTDAAADPSVRIVDTFPVDSHPSIIYPVAVTADATNPQATAFVDYLQSAEAGPIFEQHGFIVID